MKMKIIIVSMTPGVEFALAPAMLKAYCDQSADLNQAAEIVIKGYAGNVRKEQISGNAFTKNAYDINCMLDEILAEKPGIIAFSCYIWNISYVLRACRIIKSRYPDIKTILGGPQVTPYSQEIVKKYPSIDIIIRGEGEVTFSSLVKHFALGTGDLRYIDGITYREKNVIRHNKDRTLIENLDEIPSPYLSGTVDLNKIGSTIGCFETYRGCVMGCSFCNWGKNKRIRYFSLDRIRKEIELIGNSSVKRVWYADSIANLNKERFKEILRIIAQNNRNNVIYDMEMIAELLDEETIDLIGKARIGYIAFGVQSTCSEALAFSGRKWDSEKFDKNIKMLKQRTNVDVYLDLIYGLPGDNLESYRKSIEYCASLFPQRIQSHSLQILPGSEFYENHDKYGIEFSRVPPYWSKCSNTFSEKDMKQAKKWLAYLELYYFKPLSLVIKAISTRTGRNPAEILWEYTKRLRGRVSINKIISPVIISDTKINRGIAKVLSDATVEIIEDTGNAGLKDIKSYLAELVRFGCYSLVYSSEPALSFGSAPSSGSSQSPGSAPSSGSTQSPVSASSSGLVPSSDTAPSIGHRPILLPGVVADAFEHDPAQKSEYDKVLICSDYCPPKKASYIVFDNTRINRVNYDSYSLLSKCNGKHTIMDIINKFSAKLKKTPEQVKDKIVEGILYFAEAGILGFLSDDAAKLSGSLAEIQQERVI